MVEGEKDGVIESPRGGRERMMRYCEISTPVGRLLLAGDEEGLRRIAFHNELHATEVAGSAR